MARLLTNEKPQYFASIDGLRLLASVNIVLFHLESIGGMYAWRDRPLWLFRIIKGPAFHASLFFILAGFIYTVKFAPKADSFSTRVLVRGRLRDLYPLHAITCAAMIPFVIMNAVCLSLGDIGKIFYSAGVHLSMLFSLVPFGAYNLNTPSWALSAFFLCYVIFGPALRRITRISSRAAIVACMGLCCVPGLVWGIAYALVNSSDAYLFFHVFAPVRAFEFVLGMLCARLYYLNNAKPRRMQIQDVPFLNDIIICATGACLYFGLVRRGDSGILLTWLLYHVLPLPLFTILLYRCARGNGYIARFFALPLVRNLGKCGFYPYLLHIPLVSWTCWISSHFFGYKKFLHSPLNVAVFMVTLYAASYVYWLRARRFRKGTYRPFADG